MAAVLAGAALAVAPTARIARPCLVYCEKMTSPVTRTAAMIVAAISRLSMKNPYPKALNVISSHAKRRVEA